MKESTLIFTTSRIETHHLADKHHTMEQENVTMADASGANDSHGSNIRLCPLCNKPKESMFLVQFLACFSDVPNRRHIEVAFKRHAAYCKKQQDKLKKRKRSCKNCRRAKSKCSFELQVSENTAWSSCGSYLQTYIY